MIDLNNIHLDLDMVLSKRCSLDKLLNPREIRDIQLMAEKNNWDDNVILDYVYKLIKENITDYLDNSDFLDSNIIIETDPYIIKAMHLMALSQRHAQVLLVEKEYKYPGCWVSDIANALKNLQCKQEDYNILVWDAYYINDYSKNKEIPGWSELVEVLENYYDSL